MRIIFSHALALLFFIVVMAYSAASYAAATAPNDEDAAPLLALYPATHVVELFTSQSCASCPPADALVRDIVNLRTTVMLSYHVDYWNHLGWTDTHSLPAATERQKQYARQFGITPYTPQMIVDGQDQFIGSRQDEALAALGRPELPYSQDLRLDGDKLSLAFAPPAKTVVWLVGYRHAPAAVAVKTGENAGKKLRSIHPVATMETLAPAETAGQFILPIETMLADPAIRHAVLVQDSLTGIIIAAANIY